MFNSNTILGIPIKLGCTDYKHAIITQNWERWPCAVPIVYPAEHDLSNMSADSAIPTALLISPNQHNKGSWAYHTPVAMIRPINVKPLVNNHRVISTNEFDKGKFDRLCEFIHDVGCISLVIDSEAGKANAAKAVQFVEQQFKYSSLFYYDGWNTKLESEEDKVVCVITMFDLPYCVPIFNTRKVDGFGISFSAATVARSNRDGTLNRLFQTDIILSNYEDNVFVIDGAIVNNPQAVESGMYGDMTSMATTKLQIQKSKMVPPMKNRIRGMQHEQPTQEAKSPWTAEWLTTSEQAGAALHAEINNLSTLVILEPDEVPEEVSDDEGVLYLDDPPLVESVTVNSNSINFGQSEPLAANNTVEVAWDPEDTSLTWKTNNNE